MLFLGDENNGYNLTLFVRSFNIHGVSSLATLDLVVRPKELGPEDITRIVAQGEELGESGDKLGELGEIDIYPIVSSVLLSVSVSTLFYDPRIIDGMIYFSYQDISIQCCLISPDFA